MYSRQYRTAKSSSDSFDTPVSNQFAPPRFVVQPKAEEVKPVQDQTEDPQVKAEKLQQVGRSFREGAMFGRRPTSANLPAIQMKLSIGQPGDKYEQEADKVADTVVQQINQPNSESVQREAVPEEEEPVQAKSLSQTIQREALPAPEEEEVQMKPMVQRLSTTGGTAATPDVEESIQQAKGSGQPLAENVREPMERAFGADFSGVKIHTDSKSDQLNQSIQARAFTTGQDLFFKAGEYNPGSKGGQELLAHELTHVVQQTGGVQLNRETKLMNEPSQEPTNQQVQSKVIQLWPANSTKHLKDQAKDRGITEAEVDTAYQQGTVYFDPDYGGTVRWDSSTGVAVCIKPDGTVTTCYKRTGPKSRWTKK